MRFILAFFIVLIPECFAEVPSPIPTEPVYKDCSISQCGGVCKLEGGGKGVCSWEDADKCVCMPIVDCAGPDKSICGGYCLSKYGGRGRCMWLPLIDDIDPRGECVCHPTDSEDFDCSCNNTTPKTNPECDKDFPCIDCYGDCYDGQLLGEQCICTSTCRKKVSENSYDSAPCTCGKGKCTKKKKTKKTEMY